MLLLALVAACLAPPAPPPGVPTVAGRLVSHAGAPIGDALVIACASGYCQDGRTRSDGRFQFHFRRASTVSLRADGVIAGPGRRATAWLPHVRAGGEPVDVGDWVAPDLPPPVPLPARGTTARWAVGDGLALMIARDALRAPVHTYLHEGAARRLPDAAAAAFTGAGSRVLAVYAIEPFGTHSRTPIAVEATVGGPAQPVHFVTIDATDGRWSPPVPGWVDDAGSARSAPGEGVLELSYLVVTAAP